ARKSCTTRNPYAPGVSGLRATEYLNPRNVPSSSRRPSSQLVVHGQNGRKTGMLARPPDKRLRATAAKVGRLRSESVNGSKIKTTGRVVIPRVPIAGQC